MKIAIIQPRLSYYVGGGEKLPIIHTKLLAEKEHDILVYTTKVPLQKQSFLYKDFITNKTKNITIRELDIPSKYAYIYKEEAGQNRNRWDTECLLFNQLVYGDLKKDKPDLLISYYILDGLFRPIEIPAVLYLLGYPSDDLELRTSLLNFFDGTISVSKVVYDYWKKYLNKNDKNIILNSGVDIDQSISKIKSRFKFNIVFAGRLVDRKGVPTLIEAFADILDRNKDIHLWIIGDGPEKDKYETVVNKLGLRDYVSFTGTVSNLKDYFKMSDTCVFPSYEKEGLMGVVLEAMSEAKPVITTLNNGNEDIIINNKNGVLIAPRDKNELVKSLNNLIKNQDKRFELGINARKTILEKFTWEIFIEKFNKYLSQFI